MGKRLREELEDDDVEDAHYVEGGEEARRDLSRWIAALKGSSEVERGFPLKLLQTAHGTTGTEVNSWECTLDMEPADMADTIVSCAEKDAEEFPGRVKYAVRTFIHGNPKRHVFTLLNVRPKITDEDDDELDDGAREPANIRGTLHQSMSLTKVFAQTTLKSATMGIDVLQETNRTLNARILTLEAKLEEKDRLIEDVRSLQWERDLAREQIKKKMEREEQGMKALMMGGGLIASKYLGVPPQAIAGMMGGGPMGAPPGPSAPPAPAHAPSGPNPYQFQRLMALEMVVEGLLGSLMQKPEKMQALVGVLEPMELAALQEIHAYFVAKHQQEEPEPERDHPNGHTESTPKYSPFIPPTNGA